VRIGGMPETASALARSVAAQISRRTLWRRLWSTSVPSLPNILREGPVGARCPRCARLLPGGGRNLSIRTSGLTIASITGEGNRTDRELIEQCLVDGPRSRSAADFEFDELARACALIRDAFSSCEWPKWALMLDWALGREDRGGRAEALVQALLLLRGFSRGMRRSRELEVLVTSLARHAPPRSSVNVRTRRHSTHE
jgi:hypothetical protein